MKKLFSAALTLALLGGASTAQAQDAAAASPYVGLSGGYHDITTGGVDSGAIYGVVAGVDVPVGETLHVGVEGNYHLGSNAIDSEYGVAARLAFPTGPSSNVFVRAGYQWVDFDLSEIAGGLPVPAGLDDTEGDYLVGAGAEFSLGGSGTRVRVGVDTVAFDTVRATAGLIFRF